MAKSVLLDDYKESARLMILIGNQEEIIPENGYHGFPLFREFRKSPEFLNAYKKVYGHAFAVQLQRMAKEEQGVADIEIKKLEKEKMRVLAAEPNGLSIESKSKRHSGPMPRAKRVSKGPKNP